MTKQIITDPRILELKEKIKDNGYVQGAIQRIALVLSDRILEVKDTMHERRI
ncbi:hypothetical protein K7J14_01750 [Treponema zuelzerae]|uniref:Uncharacterized protein n=1 Tax=Teretinema zuelzerae TaxID=156 RepID=A0AAE3EGR8_9SPIR|nr:hypothetical protein [Teretinema zuelzerae]MCD1653421.1 hypothetical protein [Teretinema zuelzerae]